jgi:RNA methyltransferase, TrmH family
VKRIESNLNPFYRDLRELASSARHRRSLGLSVIEGLHLLEAFLAGGGRPMQLYLPERSFGLLEGVARGASSSAASMRRVIEAAGVAPVVLSDRLFATVSQVENGPGPIAVIQTPRPLLPERLTSDGVYLDRVQDPGNVGTVLRSCAALGVGIVLTSPATAFCWSPKVLRAAMGAHFHLEIHEGVDAAGFLARLAVPAAATLVDAALPIDRADLSGPRFWIFGNEGEGIDPGLVDAPGVLQLAIPQASEVDSLNVGVAAAICLYEQSRQRRAMTRTTG